MIEGITPGAWLILIGQGFTLVGTVVAIVRAIQNGKAVKQLTVNVDGKMEEFIKLVKTSSHAEGKLEGVAQEKLDKLV